MSVAESTLKWAQREREATRWSHLAVAFLLGWVSCSASYSIPRLWWDRKQLEVVETRQIPALKHQIVVEHKKADEATREKNAVIDAVTETGR